MQRALIVASSLLVLTWALSANAQSCSATEVKVDGAGWTPALEQRLRQEIQVEIQRANLCDGEPRAVVLFSWDGSGSIGVEVNFTAQGTERTLRRRADPAQLPADGLMLTLAAVAGELLQEVQRLGAPVEEAPTPWVGYLGARLAGEGFSGGLLLGGGDLTGRWWPIAAFGIDLSAGGRVGLSHETPLGVIRSQAMLFGLGVDFRAVQWGQTRLSVEVGATSGLLWLEGHGREGQQGLSQQGWLLDGRVGVELLVGLGGFGLSIRLGLDAPFHGVAATDGAQTLVAASGVGGYMSVGGGWAF